MDKNGNVELPLRMAQVIPGPFAPPAHVPAQAPIQPAAATPHYILPFAQELPFDISRSSSGEKPSGRALLSMAQSLDFSDLSDEDPP